LLNTAAAVEEATQVVEAVVMPPAAVVAHTVAIPAEGRTAATVAAAEPRARMVMRALTVIAPARAVVRQAWAVELPAEPAVTAGTPITTAEALRAQATAAQSRMGSSIHSPEPAAHMLRLQSAHIPRRLLV
jgi:hypothetical protein